jgi:hypothetical protein
MLAPLPGAGADLVSRAGPAAGAGGGEGARSVPGAPVSAPTPGAVPAADDAGAVTAEVGPAGPGELPKGPPVYVPGIIEYPPGPPGTGKSSHSSQNVTQPVALMASAMRSTASRSLPMISPSPSGFDHKDAGMSRFHSGSSARIYVRRHGCWLAPAVSACRLRSSVGTKAKNELNSPLPRFCLSPQVASVTAFFANPLL